MKNNAKQKEVCSRKEWAVEEALCFSLDSLGSLFLPLEAGGWGNAGEEHWPMQA